MSASPAASSRSGRALRLAASLRSGPATRLAASLRAGRAFRLGASSRSDRAFRPGAVLLVAGVLVLAALLRFDAAQGKYGPVPGVAFSEATQRSIRALAAPLIPAAVRWERDTTPYQSSDPIAYLRKARAMERFYASDTREPLYVASVRAFLAAFGDRDVAISYASGFYSVLLVWATYLLGAYAFCRWVGLGAALALAIEFDAIGLAVDGWRDDAFSFFTVLSLYAMLRLRDRPAPLNGVGAGFAAGAACLTRVTALSFVLPALLLAALPFDARSASGPGAAAPSWRRRTGAVLLATGVMSAALGPFLFNCWRERGDPLYSINFATQYYRDAGGLDASAPMGVGTYLGTLARSQPIEFVDVALNGVTTYPLDNKWRGFAPWSRLLPPLLRGLSVLGVALALWSPAGRFLLLTGLASLAPYAFTWTIPGGSEWRFTLHIYPLLLIAAFHALHQAARFVARLADPDFRIDPFEQRRLLHRAFATTLLGTALWLALAELPHAAVLEDLRGGRAANVRAGPGDGRYFLAGWHPPRGGANVTARYNRASASFVRLPMLAGREHRLTLRLQPYHQAGAPPERLILSLNGERLAEIELAWDPDRVGSYDVDVPARWVRGHDDVLGFVASTMTRASSASGNPFVVDGEPVGFFVWYINVTALATGAG